MANHEAEPSQSTVVSLLLLMSHHCTCNSLPLLSVTSFTILKQTKAMTLMLHIFRRMNGYTVSWNIYVHVQMNLRGSNLFLVFLNNDFQTICLLEGPACSIQWHPVVKLKLLPFTKHVGELWGVTRTSKWPYLELLFHLSVLVYRRTTWRIHQDWLCM